MVINDHCSPIGNHISRVQWSRRQWKAKHGRRCAFNVDQWFAWLYFPWPIPADN